MQHLAEVIRESMSKGSISAARKHLEYLDIDTGKLSEAQILDSYYLPALTDERNMPDFQVCDAERKAQAERYIAFDWPRRCDFKITIEKDALGNTVDPYIELGKSGITGKYADMQLDNYSINYPEQKKVYDWIMQHDNKWMFMSGSPGTGKTHLAIGVLRRRIMSQKTGCYVTAFDMLKNCIMDYNGDGGQLVRYETVDCLVVDECEKFWATKSENDRNIFFDIIEKRYSARRQTICITNAEKDEMIARMGETHLNPMISRFKEMGNVLYMNWTDYRGILNLENK
jgi:DNA replication protein DnaC